MGRVRTKTVKKSAKVIIERYYPKLSLDFETNKRICDEVRTCNTDTPTYNEKIMLINARFPLSPPSVCATRSPATPRT